MSATADVANATATRTRLRILHTESSMGWGGQEIRILTESRGFLQRGHDVVVFAAPESRLLEEAPRFGVPAVALPIGRKRPAGVAALMHEFRARRPDVVNTHSSIDSWLSAIACQLLGRDAPVIVRTRHVSVPVPNDPATRWLYRRAAAHTVTTGDALRETLVRNNGLDPSRVDSVPTGIDPALYARWTKAEARAALGLPAHDTLVGIVATLRSWKGHRYLVDAMTRLANAQARLVIVGDGPQREALQRQVDALGLRGRVVFAGQQHDVAPWLAALDVFALPSYANEGVPQALLQAMFAGVPCVTTHAGAIGEIARDGDTAIVVAKEDAEALARGIDRVLDDPDAAAARARRARAYVSERYSFERMLDRMEDVFRRAIATRRRLSASAA